MDRAIILLGRCGRTESYQLLIDCSYILTSYDGSFEREVFLKEISDRFVERILEEDINLEIGTRNGLRINPETGKGERILPLEDEIVTQLRETLINRYQLRRQLISVPSMN